MIYHYWFCIYCFHHRFPFQKLYTLSALTSEWKIQKIITVLLLVNLCYSGIYYLSRFVFATFLHHMRGYVLNRHHPCRYAFPIKCTEAILSDDKETVIEIRAEYDPSKTTKPKVFFSLFPFSLCLRQICNCCRVYLSFFLWFMQGVLHWVAESSHGVDPLKVEVRMFDKLFLSEVENNLFFVKFSLSLSLFLKSLSVWLVIWLYQILESCWPGWLAGWFESTIQSDNTWSICSSFT